MFAAAATNECVKKLYNNKRALILCVCNATYCDTVEPVGSLERYEAAVYTTSRSGRRLQRRTDVFVDEEKLKEGLIKYKNWSKMYWFKHVVTIEAY